MLILASKSPRRRELLTMLGLEFEVCTADIDETMDTACPIAQAVEQVSRRKAEAVGAKHPGDLIIAADTAVVLDREILGKPHSKEEAAQMLRRLSGKEHTVMTAFCLYRDGNTESHVEQTAVRFKTLSDREIDAYIKTGSPMDKAGAYGIQDAAAVFIRSIKGDYYNVMGLPLCALTRCLRCWGVPVLGTVEP